MAVEGRPKKIFVSHAANDPDWPVTAVEAFAAQLRKQGAEVWLDHWHEQQLQQKLPLAEWRQWMRGCLDGADHVLCLCSTRYAALAHRDNEAEPAGRGVAFEAFEIEKRLYNQKQHNRNWVWILKLEDAASAQVVPKFLEDRCPEYSTPSEDDRLVRDLVGRSSRHCGPEPTEPVQGEGTQFTPTKGEARHTPSEAMRLFEQRKLVRERLEQCPEFWQRLLEDDWQGKSPAASAMDSPMAFSNWLAVVPTDQAQVAMKVVRRVLKQSFPGDDLRRRAELAGVSVYLLAVCNLVAVEKLGAAQRFPRSVREQAHLYCAIISTVMIGGRLDLQPSEHLARPAVRHAYEILVPAAGDNRQDVFDRAVFQALFAKRRSTTTLSLEDAPLSKLDRARLQERLEEIKDIDRSALTLVVHVDALYPPADDFAQQYDVPVFVCSDEVSEVLVGMTVERLVADIEGLWRQLSHCSRPEETPTSTTSEQPNRVQESSMNDSARPSTVTINVGGAASVAVSTGNTSPATSGAVTSNVNQAMLQEWKQVDELLADMRQIISSKLSERARDKLLPVVEQALNETRAAPVPDSPKRLKGFLESIKNISDAVEGGEKIVEACGKALAIVLPLIPGL